MSLADAQADIASALEMLQESGEPVVFSYAVDPIYDNDTGDLISGGTSGTQAATAILKDTPIPKLTEPTSCAATSS